MPYRSKEERNRRRAELQQIDPARFRIANQRMYARRKDKILAYQREYRLTHPTKLQQARKEYYAAHTETLKAYQHEYRLANADKLKDYRQRPERKVASILHTNKRRMQMASNRSGLRAVYEIASARKTVHCFWCGKATRRRGDREVDHIVPLSKGGSDSTDNLCIACANCNRRKSNKMPNEFSAQLVMF